MENNISRNRLNEPTIQFNQKKGNEWLKLKLKTGSKHYEIPVFNKLASERCNFHR